MKRWKVFQLLYSCFPHLQGIKQHMQGKTQQSCRSSWCSVKCTSASQQKSSPCLLWLWTQTRKSMGHLSLYGQQYACFCVNSTFINVGQITGRRCCDVVGQNSGRIISMINCMVWKRSMFILQLLPLWIHNWSFRLIASVDHSAACVPISNWEVAFEQLLNDATTTTMKARIKHLTYLWENWMQVDMWRGQNGAEFKLLL